MNITILHIRERYSKRWDSLIRFLRVVLGLPHHWEQREGWTGKLPFYEIMCEEHGLQFTYPQGHNLNLKCPKCLKE